MVLWSHVCMNMYELWICMVKRCGTNKVVESLMLMKLTSPMIFDDAWPWRFGYLQGRKHATHK